MASMNKDADSMMWKRNGLGQGIQFEIGAVLIIMHLEEVRTVSEDHVIVPPPSGHNIHRSLIQNGYNYDKKS